MRWTASVLLVALALAIALPSEAARGSKKKKKKRSAAPRPAAVVRPPDPDKVTFKTVDGVLLAATFRPVAAAPQAPAVLLLHDFSRDRRQWEAWSSLLNERGLSTLALDLRAHGESGGPRGTRPASPSPSLLKDPNGFPRDVEAACAWLRAHASRVGVMGLSVGANLAVLATASGWAETGVALSASTDRLSLLAGARPTAPRSLLAVASQDDPGRAKSARDLHESGRDPRSTLVLPGAAHNLDLFTQHPEAREAALSWLAENLGAIPPPSPVVALPAPTPAPTAAGNGRPAGPGDGASSAVAAPSPAPSPAVPPEPRR